LRSHSFLPTSTLTMSKWEYLEATWRGVSPYVFWVFMFFLLSWEVICFKYPFSQALCSSLMFPPLVHHTRASRINGDILYSLFFIQKSIYHKIDVFQFPFPTSHLQLTYVLPLVHDTWKLMVIFIKVVFIQQIYHECLNLPCFLMLTL